MKTRMRHVYKLLDYVIEIEDDISTGNEITCRVISHTFSHDIIGKKIKLDKEHVRTFFVSECKFDALQAALQE